MFVQKNDRLENLVRNSVVLKTKLTDEQIQKFVDKVQTMDFQTQEKLAEKFEEDAKKIEKENQKNLEKLKKYSDEVFHEARKIKKEIVWEIEEIEHEDADLMLEEMLKEI